MAVTIRKDAYCLR